MSVGPTNNIWREIRVVNGLMIAQIRSWFFFFNPSYQRAEQQPNVKERSLQILARSPTRVRFGGAHKLPHPTVNPTSHLHPYVNFQVESRFHVSLLLAAYIIGSSAGSSPLAPGFFLLLFPS